MPCPYEMIALAERRKLGESPLVSISTAHALAALQVPGVRLGLPPSEPVRRLPSGIVRLDRLLDGGLPHGYLSEFVGGPSSGRTALMHAVLASATQRGQLTAVVDAVDALDPPSLARAGVDLERVLWVRPPTARGALRCAELILCAGGFGLVAVDMDPQRRADRGGRRGDRAPFGTLPHAAWVRLAQVTRRAGAVVLLRAPQRLTVSGAAVVLQLNQLRAQWSAHVFDGITTRAELTRSRFGGWEQRVTLAFGEGSAGAAEVANIPRWSGGGEAVGRAQMR